MARLSSQSTPNWLWSGLAFLHQGREIAIGRTGRIPDTINEDINELTSPDTKSKSWKYIEYLSGQKCNIFEWYMKFPSKWLELEGFYKNKLFFQPCTLLPLGTQWAVAADSSLLHSVCSLLSVQVALRDLGDSPFQWTFITGMLDPV